MLAKSESEIKQKEREAKWTSVDRALSCSLVAPAVRTVVVKAWVNSDGSVGHEIVPVIAISARVDRHFTKRYFHPQLPSGEGTEKDLLSEGWDLEEQTVKYSAIIADSETGDLVEHNGEDMEQLYCSEQRVVACPWPPEKDEEELVWAIKEAGESAQRRQAWRKKERAA